MNNYAEQIKQSVTMRQVCNIYGIEVNRAGFACCPFHNEKTPSMKIYDGSRGYFCFGCKKSGDVISFVKEYFNLTFPASIDKLNSDFHLGLPIGEKLTPAEEEKAKKETGKRTRSRIADRIEHKRLQERYNTALDKFAELDKKRIVGEANAKQGIITDDFAESLREIETAKYELQEAETELWRFEQKWKN